MTGNNSITVSDITTGDYTVEVTAVINSNDMNVENNRIVEMITVCSKSTVESGMAVCVHMSAC